MDPGGTGREAERLASVAVVAGHVAFARGAYKGDVDVGYHSVGDLGDAVARLVLHRAQRLVDGHSGADPISNFTSAKEIQA